MKKYSDENIKRNHEEAGYAVYSSGGEILIRGLLTYHEARVAVTTLNRVYSKGASDKAREMHTASDACVSKLNSLAQDLHAHGRKMREVGLPHASEWLHEFAHSLSSEVEELLKTKEDK